jgi:uncharacterized protein
MSDIFRESHRRLQDRFDTRRLADRVDQTIVHDSLTESDVEFIAGLDMFFLATVDGRGRVNCSYKGGERGFVQAIDARTLAFPNYDGNGMYLSMGNIGERGEIGMLFIDFAKQRRMRVNGVAELSDDEVLRRAYPEAQFVVLVQVREVFANCPRYIHKLEQVQASRFVPRPGCATPVPAWKQSDFVGDTLPSGDPARDPDREVLDR